MFVFLFFLVYLYVISSNDEERDVALWFKRSLVVRCVVGSILHGGPIELFLIPASDP